MTLNNNEKSQEKLTFRVKIDVTHVYKNSIIRPHGK